MRPVLAVKNLNVSLYKRPILHQINLDVLPNQIVVLLGPKNGGKSTLIRTVCASFCNQPNATIQGEMLYKGKALTPVHAPTMVIQKAHMLLGTVFDNLSKQASPTPTRTTAPNRQSIEQFLCKLNLIQLAESLDTEVLDLSMLERKKLLVANALLTNPELIALDEPTTDLNDQDASEFLDFIHTITDQHAVLMSCHTPHHARAIAHTICLMADGKIAESQPVDTFFSAPRSKEAHDYLRSHQYAVPSFDTPPIPQKTDALQSASSDKSDHDFPEIEFNPLHDGQITEPDFGTPTSSPKVLEDPNSFLGARPKTLTSNPVHTEHDDKISQSDEELQNTPDFLTSFSKRSPAQIPNPLNETRGPRGFRWLRARVLAGTPQPGLFVDIKQDLHALKRVGITHLITLTEEPLQFAAFQDFDLVNIHFPIPNRQFPDIKATSALCTTVAELIKNKATIAYHCQTGTGRTGTMLIAQLVWEGLDVLDAIAHTQNIYQPWVQSTLQKNFLTELQHTLRPDNHTSPQNPK